MKSAKFIICAAAAAAVMMFAGCTDVDAFENPGDYLGGGEAVDTVPEKSQSDSTESATDAVGTVETGESEVPYGATQISGKCTIETAGDYYVSGEVSGKITIGCAGVTLYLYNATITNDKKVIEDDYGYGLTITLIGENSIKNTNTEGSNAIDCAGDLIINGDGSLTVTATKNAIKGNSISVVNATLNITAAKDGLHAEVEKYDTATEEPTPSYNDGGYVYINGATVNIMSDEDGIQADTFVYITGESNIDITAGDGATDTVTQNSSDNASGKGIKAGPIDWGTFDEDIEWDGYLVYIEDGTITVDSNDDALHSDGEMQITGGTINLKSGDDAMHADNLIQIWDGTSIDIDKCYEGIEAAKIEIYGGTIEVESYEDGINAADGTIATPGKANSNCHIIITDGYISVNCIGSEGDGIDSNGSMLISGGELYIAGSSNSSDAALDSDGGIVIDGGYVFAVGALGMVETPSTSSAQYCVSFAKSQSIDANTTLYLCDSYGNVIMYFKTPRSCQSVIISCPELQKGETYMIYGGDSLLATFTVSSKITSVGSSGSISNPSGTPGGGSISGGHGFGNGR